MKQILTCLVLFSTFSFITAQTNYSLSFDGEDDYVSIGDVTEFSNGAITVSVKVKPNSLQTSSIIDRWAGSVVGYRLGFRGDTGAIWAQFGANDKVSSGNNAYSLNEWIEITGVWKNNNYIKLYIDGLLIGETSTLEIFFTDKPLEFARSSYGSNDTDYFSGLMDEVAIWSFELSESQINSYVNSNIDIVEGLVGYWNFNEGSGTTLTDQTSNDNDGTIYGATWSTDVPTPPDNNYSLSFDGEDDYVEIAGNTDLVAQNNIISINAWAKIPTSNASVWAPIIHARPGYGYLLYAGSSGTNNGVARFDISTASNSYEHVDGFTDLRDDQWHLITATYDGSTAKLYVDGILENESDFTTDYLASQNGEEILYIGGQTNEYLNGFIDKVSIWNVALTEDQINMYSDLTGNETGLVGYWNFNDGEGTVLTDLSGNGNHGTINGATWSDDGAPVQPATFASLSVGTVDAVANSAVLVPIDVDLMGESISSVEIHFGGFQGHVDFVAVDTIATLVGDAEWNIEINEQEDLLLTLSYGASEISTNGTLLRLKFEVPNNIDTDFVPVVITHAEMDENEGIIDVVDGGIEIESLLYGDVSQNGNISGYDASLVLKYLVGTETFNETQLVVAEVTQDGTISALDATAIAQYAIEIIDALPVADTQNLAGSGTLFINETMFQPGELLEVPVMLTNGDNLLSFEIDLSYESEAITLESVVWSDLISHFTIEENYEAGSIKIAGLGTEPDGEEGVFATISLFIASSFTDESFDVTINKYRINESDPAEDVVVTFTNSALGIDENTIPTVYALHQNYPNPFNPTTQVKYDLPETGSVQIMIYDLMGRKVRTLINSEQNAGFKTLQWNATNDRNEPVSAGLYLYTIQAGEFRQTKKMVLLK